MEVDRLDRLELGQLEQSAVEALHQTMIVLREELQAKNRVIKKLRKKIKTPDQQNSFSNNRGCLITIEDCAVGDRDR